MASRDSWDPRLPLALLAVINLIGFQACLRLSVALGQLRLAGALWDLAGLASAAADIAMLAIASAVLAAVNVVASQLAFGDLGWALLNHVIVYYLSGFAFGLNPLALLACAPASLMGAGAARVGARERPRPIPRERAERAALSSATYFLAGFGASYTTHLLVFCLLMSPRGACAPYPVGAYVVTLIAGLALSVKLGGGPLFMGALSGIGPAGLAPLLYYSLGAGRRGERRPS